MAKSQTSKAAESPDQEDAPKKSRATKGSKTAGKSETKTTKTGTKSESKAKTSKAKTTSKAAGDAAPKSRSRAKKQAEPETPQQNASQEPSRKDIARRAHELFEERGGQHGYHDQDWQQAERELREGRQS